MNEQEFETFLLKGNLKKIQSFFKNMTETDRKMYKSVSEKIHIFQSKQRLSQFSDTSKYDSKIYDSACLACIATSNLSYIKKHIHDFISSLNDTLKHIVLSERNPAWLNSYLNFILENSSWTWAYVRSFKDSHPEFVFDKEAYTLGLMQFNPKVSRVEYLLKNSDLLEKYIWNFFIYEGGGEVSLSNCEKYRSKQDQTWTETLITLSKNGHISRTRLLKESLNALNQDFSQYRAGWFSRFHEHLKPTVEERIELLKDYLDLLNNDIPPTVTLAIKALEQLDKSKKLDYTEFLDYAEPIMYAKAMSSVKKGIKLLTNAFKTNPSLQENVAIILSIGLEHSKQEIQDLCAKHILTIETPDDNLKQEIHQRLDLLSTTTKNSIQIWLGNNTKQVNTRKKDLSLEPKLVKELEKLSKQDKEFYGISSALNAFSNNSFFLPALNYTNHCKRIPYIKNDLAQINNIDDIFRLTLEAFQEANNTALCLHLMNAYSKTNTNNIELTHPLIKPLKKSTQKLYKQLHKEYNSVNFATPVSCLLFIVDSWLSQLENSSSEIGIFFESLIEKNNELNFNKFYENTFFIFLCNDVIKRIKKNEFIPMLTAIESSNGWVGLDNFINTYKQYIEASIKPSEFDLIFALLNINLTGVNVKNIESKFSDFDLKVVETLNYLLGVKNSKINTTPTLLAASRSRYPFNYDKNLITKNTTENLFGVYPSEYEVQVIQRKQNYDGKNHFYTSINLVSPFIDVNTTADSYTWDTNEQIKNQFPSYFEHSFAQYSPISYLNTCFITSRSIYISSSARYCAWLTALHPINRSLLVSAALYSHLSYADIPKFGQHLTKPCLTLLHNYNEPISTLAIDLIICVTNETEKNVSMTATDLLINLFEDGRLDGKKFGERLNYFLFENHLLPKRSAPYFKQIIQHSDLCSYQMLHALTISLHKKDTLRPIKDLHVWLELLIEICTKYGEQITDLKSIEYLKSTKPSTKAGKLAKILLAKKANPSLQKRKQVALEAVKLRYQKYQEHLYH